MPSPCAWRCATIRQANETGRQGMLALSRGDLALAETLQRKALGLLFSLGGFDVLRARLHNNLGVVLSSAARPAEAQREFARALYLVRGRVDEASRFHQALSANHRQTARPYDTKADAQDAAQAA